MDACSQLSSPCLNYLIVRFSSAHQLLVANKLSRHDITEMVATANVALRYTQWPYPLAS